MGKRLGTEKIENLMFWSIIIEFPVKSYSKEKKVSVVELQHRRNANITSEFTCYIAALVATKYLLDSKLN